MLSGLLYQLSYQPTKIIIHQSWGLSPPPTPNIFGAALPTRQGAKGYHPKTVAMPRKVFRDECNLLLNHQMHLRHCFPPPSAES
jgi:hypothetical protein